MSIVYQVFDQCIEMMTELFNTALQSWGIFGSFIIFIALVRIIARTFNRTKGST